MSHMILVQCTKSKLNRKSKAKDLYTESDYFCKMKRYAESEATQKGVAWGILSAKHGLVPPGRFLEPYDEFGLSQEQADEIAELLEGDWKTVEILAGKEYADPLKEAFDETTVMDPLEGLSIGKRMERLQEMARQSENHQLC